MATSAGVVFKYPKRNDAVFQRLNRPKMFTASDLERFCPGVPVHRGKNMFFFFVFRNDWLAVVYCLVLCRGSCNPVHEDRTPGAVKT